MRGAYSPVAGSPCTPWRPALRFYRQRRLPISASGELCQWRFIVEGDWADCKASCTTENRVKRSRS
jgi:hypothetical protein